MINNSQNVDIHQAVYRFQSLLYGNTINNYSFEKVLKNLFPRKEHSLEKTFLKEVEERKDLRQAYLRAGYFASDKEIDEAIETIRRQD